MEKTPLVFCPGLLNDAALWAHQVDSLGDLALASVADLTQADTIAALAQAVLAEAPPRFALAGLSMGGYVAFEILRQAPHRVIRLALLNTSARPDGDEARQRRLDMVGIAKRGGFPKIPPQLMASQLYAPNIERLRDVIVGMAGRIGSDAFIRQQNAIMTRLDSRPGLSAIACPTLVVGGRQDALTTPEIMGEIAAGIPGAKFVPVDQCGHLSPLEQPQAVSALLRYWLLG